MTPRDLGLLSDLLDEGHGLFEPEREAWLATLEGDALRLLPTLRELLARQASKETDDLLDRLPAFAIPAPGPAAGDTIGPYRLLSELGAGGMGAVWLAERVDGSFRRKVALKLPHLTWAPGLTERFAREREILSSLEHPNIARLYDAGVDQHGRPFMALEYVEGQAIDVYCKQRSLPLEGRLRLLLQVTDAVAFAHSRLVVHRDLKPGNILVTGDGQVRLLDFGIAKLMEVDRASETALTQASGRALTLDYASPEQIRGEPIGTASDVYSLAVVAFEVLVGARPYRLKRGSAAELEEAILAAEAPRASEVADAPALKKQLRGDLDAILNKALKKQAGERYATVDALAQDWRRYLDGQRVHARADTLAYRLARLARRHRRLLAAGAVAGLAFALAIGVGATAVVIFALLLGLGAALWQAGRAREQARIARVEGRKADAVKRFLLDIFETNSHGQQDPLKAQQTTARELLDIGVRRVDESLRDEPESRIEVLDSLAELYFQIGLRTEAAHLRRQATDLARQTFGARDARFARVAILCARAIEGTSQRAEVPGLLEEANAALLAAGESDSVLRGTLLHELASYYRYDSLGPALRVGEQAAEVLRRTAVGIEVANACRMAGRVRLIAGHYDLAEQHYRLALAVPSAPGDGGDGWRVNGHAELAEALFKQGRVEESERHARTAFELSRRSHGPDHRWTMVVKMRLANQVAASGGADEAMALRTEVEQALALDRPEYDAQFRADMAGYLGMTLLDRGRPDLSEPLQLHDFEDLREYFPHSYMLAEREAELADLALVYGRYDQAQSLIDAARQRWQRYAGDHAAPARGAMFALVGARLGLARGQPDDAMVCLDGVAAAPTAALGRFHFKTMQLMAERAQVEIARGQPGVARDVADAELRALRQQLGNARLPDPQARLLLARGQALQALGDLARAEDDLQAALALRHLHDDEASLWLAQVQIALAGCLAASGRRDDAQALLDRASHIHAKHRPLGRHLAAQLERAREALRS